jgi:uncharacterized protein (DUF983 family)
MKTPSIWTVLGRTLRRRCPECGQGPLFRGYLGVLPRCPVCAAENGAYPSDDLPPYLTIVVVGHVIVPLFVWSDLTFAPPLSLQFMIWVPLTALVALSVLPFAKGVAIALCWASGIVRPARLG